MRETERQRERERERERERQQKITFNGTDSYLTCG